jgi:CRP/FNR family cyclic AMP-dependent transcriptional regulator
MALLKRQSHKMDVLVSIPLFGTLSKKELTSLARLSDEVTVAEGTTLMKQGDRATQAVVILSGACTVRRNGRKIADLGKGDIAGEIGLVTDQPSNATVKTTKESTLLVLTGGAFSDAMTQMPSMALKVLKVVAARLAENERNST